MKIPAYFYNTDCVIYLYEGNSAYEKIYSDNPIYAKCFIKKGKDFTKSKQSSDEIEIVPTLIALFPPNVEITKKSKVNIDDNEYYVLQVITHKGFTESHKEVLLQ